ncbi:hypothetical protein AOQ84DRAFT_379239 [Glonium stellatum]|uniref:Uncharacterized protein n=1 Tax=Glonium stellatum TaxID=574774 RepID=A0A8E2EW60_9PEZI|nr:hypothetical protein AOQ84DRAFT_379239 [Glonium stellatum]
MTALNYSYSTFLLMQPVQSLHASRIPPLLSWRLLSPSNGMQLNTNETITLKSLVIKKQTSGRRPKGPKKKATRRTPAPTVFSQLPTALKNPAEIVQQFQGIKKHTTDQNEYLCAKQLLSEQHAAERKALRRKYLDYGLADGVRETNQPELKLLPHTEITGRYLQLVANLEKPPNWSQKESGEYAPMEEVTYTEDQKLAAILYYRQTMVEGEDGSYGQITLDQAAADLRIQPKLLSHWIQHLIEPRI